MINIHEAFSILENAISPLQEVDVSLHDARNGVLAETIFSPIDMPPFRQSNMDGFAVALHGTLEYKIVGEVKAGDENQILLQPGEAVRIFTGAAVPDSAQAVMQIEKVSVNGNQLTLHENIAAETNVRPKSAQISINDIAIEKGAFLNPAAIGFLAGLGFTAVRIYKKPTVGIVITGNELVQPGNNLPYGKVYDSNSIMLQSALRNEHYQSVLYRVNDDFENTKAVLNKAISENDVVLVSGGISVGDYDFVGKALSALGTETLFYKVSQKPGKPLYAGKLNNKTIFALPGNPAAGLTCFYIYVRPTLQKLSGIPTNFGSAEQKILAHDYDVSNTRSQFLKSVIEGETVKILDHQESSMLDSFAISNALVYLRDGNYKQSKGDSVTVYKL